MNTELEPVTGVKSVTREHECLLEILEDFFQRLYGKMMKRLLTDRRRSTGTLATPYPRV